MMAKHLYVSPNNMPAECFETTLPKKPRFGYLLGLEVLLSIDQLLPMAGYQFTLRICLT